jgi:hypothetical protein
MNIKFEYLVLTLIKFGFYVASRKLPSRCANVKLRGISKKAGCSMVTALSLQ